MDPENRPTNKAVRPVTRCLKNYQASPACSASPSRVELRRNI